MLAPLNKLNSSQILSSEISVPIVKKIETPTLKSEEKPAQTESQLLKENVDKLALSKNTSSTSSPNKELSEGEKKQVEALKKRDREVKAHEAAHMASGAGLAGGATYSYTTGPDGKQYVVGGEVKIEMTVDLNKPDETIRKMEQVKRAALAPSDPSPQDRQVATMASQNQNLARAEMRKQELEKTKYTGSIDNKIINAYKNSGNESIVEKGKNLDATINSINQGVQTLKGAASLKEPDKEIFA